MPVRRFLCAAWSVSLVLLFTACGIEDIIYLYPPTRTYENSNLDDVSKRYCEFRTADSENARSEAEPYFKGTEIYYRIYESEADCVAATKDIEKRNEDNPAGIALYLLETINYSRLAFQNIDIWLRPLIVKSNVNRRIRFRLQNYSSGGTGSIAALTIDGAFKGVPCRGQRIVEEKRLFTGANISRDDVDVVKTSSAASQAFWYVNFYAASYGYDDSFKTIYSSVAHLGFIKIDKAAAKK